MSDRRLSTLLLQELSFRGERGSLCEGSVIYGQKLHGAIINCSRLEERADEYGQLQKPSR